MPLTFVGTVKLRSSLVSGSVRPWNGPPGEAEVQSMNPQRAKKLCSLTGWPRLEPGTLNVVIADADFDALAELTSIWAEDGASVTYPPMFAHIPKQRGPYLYFRGSAR